MRRYGWLLGVLLAACGGSGGGGMDAGPGDMVATKCMAACDREASASCGIGCSSMCEAQAANARARGCVVQVEAFFDCVTAASDVCQAFMGTAGPCGTEYEAMQSCTAP